MRIAILGQPKSNKYAQALARLPDVEVIDPDDTGKLLDAAIVCDPVQQRPTLIRQLAEVTRHILCEIPFGPGETESGRVVQECHDQGVNLYPCFTFRYLPVFSSLKAMLAQNTLGKPLSVKIRYAGLSSDASSGQAFLLQNMVQGIDLMRWLLDTDTTEQYSETTTNGAILSITLVNGTYATLDVSLLSLPAYPAPEDLKLEIIGTGGWVRVDAFHQIIETFSTHGALHSNWGSDPITELLRAFTGAVKYGHPMPTAQEYLRAQQIAQTVFGTPEAR